MVSRKRGYNIKKLDPEKPLEEQGNFDIILHKLTDILAAANSGDKKALYIVKHVEQYLSNNPNVIVMEPLDKVKILLNRCQYYKILQNELSFRKQQIFTPNFVEFVTNDVDLNWELMKANNVDFPVICKPTIAHGSKSAHEMILIFNKKGLKVCKPPCIVQSFVNHNAVLHKVYVIGNRYHIIERPSVKNFYASENLEPIRYSTSEVCKADSHSTLSILDPNDPTNNTKMPLDEEKVRHVIHILGKSIGLLLINFDVVIDNVTGHHAIIDINVFPSYEQFPDFFDHLMDCIDDLIRDRKSVDLLADCSVTCNKNFNGRSGVNSIFNSLVNVGKKIK